MHGYNHIAVPYLPPNSSTTTTTTDDYMTPLPALGLGEQGFPPLTYSTDDIRR